MKGFIYIISFILVLVTSGCHHKDIECPWDIEQEVTLLFEWDNCEDADPEGMTVYFFPIDGNGLIWRFDISGKDGGKVKIPAGKYQMLAFNNDTRSIDYFDTGKYDTFSATTADLGEGIYRMPDMLWSGHVDYIDISACGLRYRRPDGSIKECVYGLIRCSPEVCVSKYTVIINDVENADAVASVTARLGGIDSGTRLHDISPLTPVGSIPFSMKVSGSSQIDGTLRGFSTHEGGENMLNIFFTLKDGSIYSASRNVTREILNNSNPRDVTIILNGFQIPSEGIPDTPVGDGDLDVGVEGWSVVEVELSSETSLMFSTTE